MTPRSENELIEVLPEVHEALAGDRAVVALESTIIAHGMPYPQNLETARSVESIVRQGGAVPATIAIIDGRVKVGLSGEELEGFAAAKNIAKASRRDIAASIAARATAGTTVAATMAIAAKAGVEVFATGGIGGVHRGAEQTFDISADLIELGRTPVTVVSAGCKSILDIPKTLECLEMQGVPVLGYRTGEFPAFYARSSGAKVDHRFDTAAAIAEVIAAERQLSSRSGILVANPIPEADALPADEIEARICAAASEAKSAGVARKDVTPYLLSRINQLTGGKSLVANIALVKNNAALAAQIAVELAALGSRGRRRALLSRAVRD